MHEIKQCQSCKKHTIKEQCCETAAAPVTPMRYSPGDKYGQYRRKAKEAERKSQGDL